MAEEVEREYLSSLVDLTVNSKPLINMLTLLADEYIRHAPSIVKTIEKHLSNTEYRLPVLYLIDSIVKNVGKDYIQLFMQNIVSTFAGVFVKVDEKTRLSMWKLRHTWTAVFSARKLHAIDVRAHSIDPAWPIQPLPASAIEPVATPVARSLPANPPSPSLSANVAATKNIHINPKIFKKNSSSGVPVPPLDTVGTSVDTMDEIVAAQMELLSLQIQAVELQLSQAASDSEKLAQTKQLLDLRTQKAKLELQQATNKLKQKQSKLLAEKSAGDVPVSTASVTGSSADPGSVDGGHSAETGSTCPLRRPPRLKAGKPVIRPVSMATACDPRAAASAARSIVSDPRIKPASDPRLAARTVSTTTAADVVKTDTTSFSTTTSKPPPSTKATIVVSSAVSGPNPTVVSNSRTTTAPSKSRSRPPPAPMIRDSMSRTPAPAPPQTRSSSGSQYNSGRSGVVSSSRELSETTGRDTDLRGGRDRSQAVPNRDRLASKPMATRGANKTAAASVDLPVTVSMASLPSFKRKRSPNTPATTKPADNSPIKSGKVDDVTVKTKNVAEENRSRSDDRSSRVADKTGGSRNRNGKKPSSSRDRNSSKKSPRKSSDRNSSSTKRPKDSPVTVGKPVEEIPAKSKPSVETAPDCIVDTLPTDGLPGDLDSVSSSSPELSSVCATSHHQPQDKPDDSPGFRRSRSLRGRSFKARTITSPEPPLVDTDMRQSGVRDSEVVYPTPVEVASVDNTDVDLRQRPAISGTDIDLRTQSKTGAGDVNLRNLAVILGEDVDLRNPSTNLSVDGDLRKRPTNTAVDVDLRKPITGLSAEDVDFRKQPEDRFADIRKESIRVGANVVDTTLGDDIDLRPKIPDSSRIGDSSNQLSATVAGKQQSLTSDDVDLRQSLRPIADANPVRQNTSKSSESPQVDKSETFDDGESVHNSKKARMSGNLSAVDEQMDSATDVDLRRSNNNNNKRSRSDPDPKLDSPNKKSHLDDLFGAEDTDLRFTESSTAITASCAEHTAEDHTEGDNQGWRQLKKAQPDQYKSPLRARPVSLIGRDVDMRLSTPSRPATSTSLSSVHQVATTTSSSTLSDRGATSPPPLSAVSPSLSTSSAVSDRTSFSSRPAATNQRDLDEELRVLEESSKLTQNNINMILKQAEDQLKAEEITWEQYNNVLSQVIRLDERQKIREQRALERRRSMSTGSSAPTDSDYRAQGPQQGFGPSWPGGRWRPEDRVAPISPPMGPYSDQRAFRSQMAPSHDQTRPFRGGPAPYGPPGPRRSGPRGVEPPMFRGRPRDSVGECPEPSSEMIAACERSRRDRSSTYINEKATDVLWYGENCICLIDWDEPRTLYFKSGARTVRIDGRPVLCRFNDNYRPLVVDGVRYQVRLGAPTREVFIDGRGFPLLFGGEPMSVVIDGQPRLISVDGPAPGVAIGRRRRTDLLCGKIQLIVDGRHAVDLYLDCTCQTFVVDGKLHVLRFRHGFDAVEVNGITVRCEFGSALPLLVHGRRHHICFSRPPAHVPIGRAAVRGLSPDRAPWPLPWRDPELAATVSRAVEDRPAGPVIEPQTTAMLAHQQRAVDDRISSLPSAVSCPSDPSAAAENPGVLLAPGASGLNIGDLLNRLVKTGLIPAGPQSGEAAKQKELEMNTIADVTWKSDSLKHRQPGVVSLLYSGIQCSSCGTRFLPEQTVQYSNHLDWHFRQNRRELATSAAQARCWYYDMQNWLVFEEVEDPDDKAEPEFDGLSESVRQKDGDDESACSAPVGEKDEDNCCQVCHEMMVKFYHEEYEEWHLRNCIRVEGAAYHPSCFEDHKTALLLQSIPQSVDDRPSQETGGADTVTASTGAKEDTIILEDGAVSTATKSSEEDGRGAEQVGGGDAAVSSHSQKQPGEEEEPARAGSPDIVFECVRLKSEARSGPPPVVVTLDDTGTELEEHMEEDAPKPVESQESLPGESQQSLPGERKESSLGESGESVPSETQESLPGENRQSLPAESQQSLPDSGVFCSESTDPSSHQTASDLPLSESTKPAQYSDDVAMETPQPDTEKGNSQTNLAGSSYGQESVQDTQSLLTEGSAVKPSVSADSSLCGQHVDTCLDEISSEQSPVIPDPSKTAEDKGATVVEAGGDSGEVTGDPVVPTDSSGGQGLDLVSVSDRSAGVERSEETGDSSVTCQDSTTSVPPTAEDSLQKEIPVCIGDSSAICQDAGLTKESGLSLQKEVTAHSLSDAAADNPAPSPRDSKSSEQSSADVSERSCDTAEEAPVLAEQSSNAESLVQDSRESSHGPAVPEDGVTPTQSEAPSQDATDAAPDTGLLSTESMSSEKSPSVSKVVSPTHGITYDTQTLIQASDSVTNSSEKVLSPMAVIACEDRTCAVAIDGELVEPAAPVSSVAPRPGIRLQLAGGRALTAQQSSNSGAYRPPQPASIKSGLVGKQIVEQPPRNAGVEESAFCSIM